MRQRAAVLCGAASWWPGCSPPSRRRQRIAHRTRAQPIWKKCGTTKYPTLQCGSVTVPLDYANPRGQQITLALSRVPHTAPTYQGPLLVNPGGPAEAV